MESIGHDWFRLILVCGTCEIRWVSSTLANGCGLCRSPWSRFHNTEMIVQYSINYTSCYYYIYFIGRPRAMPVHWVRAVNRFLFSFENTIKWNLHAYYIMYIHVFRNYVWLVNETDNGRRVMTNGWRWFTKIAITINKTMVAAAVSRNHHKYYILHHYRCVRVY